VRLCFVGKRQKKPKPYGSAWVSEGWTVRGTVFGCLILLCPKSVFLAVFCKKILPSTDGRIFELCFCFKIQQDPLDLLVVPAHDRRFRCHSNAEGLILSDEQAVTSRAQIQRKTTKMRFMIGSFSLDSKLFYIIQIGTIK